MRRAAWVLILIVAVQIAVAPISHAEPPHMIGSWKIDITFTNGESRSLRFDAQGGGRGSFLSLDPRTKVEGPGKPSEVKWNEGEASTVTFSGPFAFLLGNVGRDAGTLAFTGKLDGGNVITGEVDFAPLVGERPSKHGTFKAARIGD